MFGLVLFHVHTGEVICPEDPVAAAAVNKFLGEELARACRYNKSHNCFTADLRAFKCSEHVDAAIKEGLHGLDTYAKVQPDSGNLMVKCCGYNTMHMCLVPSLACRSGCREIGHALWHALGRPWSCLDPGGLNMYHIVCVN